MLVLLIAAEFLLLHRRLVRAVGKRCLVPQTQPAVDDRFAQPFAANVVIGCVLTREATFIAIFADSGATDGDRLVRVVKVVVNCSSTLASRSACSARSAVGFVVRETLG